MKGITLRRTKTSKVAGKQVVELPDKKVFVEHVTLSEEERREYDLAKIEGRNVIGRCALHLCTFFWFGGGGGGVCLCCYERFLFSIGCGVVLKSPSLLCRYVKEGTVLTNYADVLAILVRLRQLCCHPALLGSYGTGVNNSIITVLSVKCCTSKDLSQGRECHKRIVDSVLCLFYRVYECLFMCKLELSVLWLLFHIYLT